MDRLNRIAERAKQQPSKVNAKSIAPKHDESAELAKAFFEGSRLWN